MLYSVIFLKTKTYWHDEDIKASIIFFAENDAEAYRFSSTIARIMNKGFAKINEQRLVVSANLCQVHRVGQFGTKYILVANSLVDSLKFTRWKDLRDIYRALFPIVINGGDRSCVLNGFYEYKPMAKFTKPKHSETKDRSLGNWVSY